MPDLKFLTAAQEAQIPEFQQKWQQIYKSTAPIDRQRAAAALRQVYRIMGKPNPEIIFCSSPRAALERLRAQMPDAPTNPPPTSATEVNGFERFQSIVGGIWEIVQINQKQQQSVAKMLQDLTAQIGKVPAERIGREIESSLPKDLSSEYIYKQTVGGAASIFDVMHQTKDYFQELESTKKPEPDIDWEGVKQQIEDPAMASQFAFLSMGGIFSRMWLKSMLQSTLIAKINGVKQADLNKAIFAANIEINTGKYLVENPPVFTSELALSYTWLDFASTVLNYAVPTEKWQILQELVASCGYIFSVGNFAVICDRPTKILTDELNCLHAEGEAAIEYADGFKIYAYRGQILTERYGSVPCRRWRSEWILTECDPAILRILLREIGAVRLCREASVTELEVAAEYRLIKLNNIDLKDAIILQQIDPQTGVLDAAFIGDRSNIRSAIDYARNYISSDRFPPIDSGEP